MLNKTIWWVIVLGTVSIAGIISLQLYWFMKTIDTSEVQFQRSVTLALYNTARKLANTAKIPLPATGLILRESPDYYVVRLHAPVNALDLEHFLQSEFETQSIHEKCTVTILDAAQDEVVYAATFDPEEKKNGGGTVSKKPVTAVKTKFTKGLYNFSIRFPSRKEYVLRELQTSFITSALLLMTIVFFAYAMYVILRQQRLSQLQKDFINNMTHEFKTPISTIKIAAESFRNNPTLMQDQRLQKYVQIIREQNERLNAQVEKVLQLARIEKDQFKLNKEKINLHEYIMATIESLEIKLQEAGGNITHDLQAQKHTIMADPLHLTNVLHNLLDNAIKYTRDIPAIEIKTWNTQHHCCLSIRDNGIGIRREDLQKVWNKFYRVSTGNVHNVKGFGLGLYYVKSICDAHDWDVTIDSVINQYTEVRIFMIPLPTQSTS